MERQYSLKELRARKEVTQKQVAEVIGVTRATYNSWEQDPGNIVIAKIYELADYLDVNVEEIKIK